MLDEYPETLIGVEWHSPSFTPGNSDFDISAYSTRANLYGVGGIPHTQWGGEYETVGGYPNGNWEAMSGDIYFEPNIQRTISVDIRYTLFVIDKYANAGHLIDEMKLVKTRKQANVDTEKDKEDTEDTDETIEKK